MNLPCQWGLSQHLLDHQRIDVDHAVLEQVQCEHAGLMILAAVARHFATADRITNHKGRNPQERAALKKGLLRK